MKVDTHLVDRLAELAKLEFDAESKEEIIKDLDKMIQFVDKLSELDTEGIEPLVYVNEDVNIMRRDEVKHEVTKEEGLKNAPLKDSDYIKVPKVLNK